jgi:ABC-type oligopeptide transport system substrate-binding subunit
MAAAFAPSNASSQYGPRSDYTLYFYADENLMYSALKAGQIDLMMWELNTYQVADAKTDPNLQLMVVPRYDLRAWSLHCNYTTNQVGYWGNIRNPLNQEEFREAIFHCTNRTYYTEVVCGGYALPTYVPLTTNSRGWWNETTAAYVQNELDCDLDKAKAALAAGGWNDTDSNGIVNFPTGWDGASGQDMLPIRVIRRNDDAKRRDAMNHLISNMQAIGINLEVYDPSEWDPPMIGKNYHIYSAGWSMGRLPTGMYGWFHSSRYLVDAMSTNYHTGFDKYGNPMFPELDAMLTQLYYPTDLTAAKTACQDAQDYIMRHKIFIPLWCSKSFYAYGNLLGTVNEAGYGPEYTNTYLPLNAYRADNPGAPIRVGIKNPPICLNYILVSWVWEVAVLSRFQDSFMDLTPYNVVVDMPWVAYDWEVSTWVDPEGGANKTLVKYWLRKGQNWIQSVTGAVLGERNATDHPFNCWYYDATTAAIPYTGYRDIKYILLPNDCEVDVYFDLNSYWSWLNPWGRDMYPPAWRQEPISHLRTDVWIEGTNMTTPGVLSAAGNRSEGTPIEIVSIDVDGTPLTQDTTPYLSTHTGQYVIAGSTAGGPKIKVFADYADGQVLTATYWARGDYTGNTPGSKPWQQILIGSGPHYISELNPVIGGSVKFKANRNYWLETPPLGEVDWTWYYVDGPKPRSGFFTIDILDVVKCTAAYDSHGSGVPDPAWCSGADLAETCGVIDIFDVVSVTGKYEEKFGEPPP